MGRLTLDPLADLEVGHPAHAFCRAGSGWPVPINPLAFKGVSPKVGMGVVGIAGPIVNLVLALLVAIPLQLKLLPFLPERIGPLLVSWDFASVSSCSTSRWPPST